MRDVESIAEINKKKYLIEPSWEMIGGFISELGVKMYQFERFYHIPFNLLTQVKAGTKRLPPKYWHFIYERIVPKYGAGFLEQYMTKKPEKRIKLSPPKKRTAPLQPVYDQHDRLSAIK